MKCLIVDKMHGRTSSMLQQIGLEVDYEPNIGRPEIINRLPAYDGLIIRSKTSVDKELIDAAERLKFVGRAGAGVDNLDVELLEHKNIAIINAPEGNRNALAEQTVGMLMALLHNIVKGNNEVKQQIWDREGNRGVELSNKTVGLLGYGYMGAAFASKLKPFGCKVIAYDKYKSGYGDEYCQEATLDEVFEESDIFSIHVPLTEETRFMVDEDFINRFKKNIYLINTARGEVLSMRACCHALKAGKLKGAALDVLENEKLSTLDEEQKACFTYLCKSNNTILTPHVAGWSFESYEQISQVLTDKIKKFLTNNF